MDSCSGTESNQPVLKVQKIPVRRMVKYAKSRWSSSGGFMPLKCRDLQHRRLYCVGSMDGEPVRPPHSCMHSAHSSLACCQQPHSRRGRRGGTLCFRSWSLDDCERMRCLRFYRRCLYTVLSRL